MKYTCILLLTLIFCSCDPPPKNPIDKEAVSRENKLVLSTSEIEVDLNTKSTSSISFSRSRKDKIEELWKEILEQNEDLSKEINFISKKLETLEEEIQAIESQISNHNDYFVAITSKAKYGVKDSLLRESLLAAIDKSKFDLKNRVDILEDRKLAAVRVSEEFQEHLNILKISAVNALVHQYFKEDLSDGSELLMQTESVRKIVSQFTKRRPTTLE